MKYACYCMTRNLYPKVLPSLKSLLKNSDVDRVFLLTEDDDIGIDLPERVDVINVSDQTFFPPDGANYHNGWTWMVLMRTALCHVLPERVDRVLSLDLDTCVIDDISDLWNAPIENKYLAAVREPGKSTDGRVYINGGVILWNLRKMRDGKGDEIIRALNTTKYSFPDQAVVTALCQGGIYELSSAYNVNNYTKPADYPRILHFAATARWYDHPIMKQYREMPWEEVLK